MSAASCLFLIYCLMRFSLEIRSEIDLLMAITIFAITKLGKIVYPESSIEGLSACGAINKRNFDRNKQFSVFDIYFYLRLDFRKATVALCEFSDSRDKADRTRSFNRHQF